jgi:hypothetical protein
MKQRLPLVISVTALVVALVGSTPLGNAAQSAVEQVVPRAKRADFASNAGKLNGHKSSVSPRRGQIPVVGADGKLSASIGAVGPAGPQGERGPAGVSGYEWRQTQISLEEEGFRAAQMDCPGGKSVLGGGFVFRESDTSELSLTESRPISNSTWRFKVRNHTGQPKGAQSLYIVCANMNQ